MHCNADRYFSATIAAAALSRTRLNQGTFALAKKESVIHCYVQVQHSLSHHSQRMEKGTWREPEVVRAVK